MAMLGMPNSSWQSIMQQGSTVASLNNAAHQTYSTSLASTLEKNLQDSLMEQLIRQGLSPPLEVSRSFGLVDSQRC